MRSCFLLSAVAAAALVPQASAQFDGLFNPGFEFLGPPPSASEPAGWRHFNFSRLRQMGDGLGPILVHSGNNSVELASGTGATNNFGGFTTDVFDPNRLLFFNPIVTFPGGDVTVAGWYAIPADQPLVGASAGIKLEFRRENSSIFGSFESLSITGHTSGEWLRYSLTVTNQQLDDIFQEFPPWPVMVSVLPLRFGSSTSTGTIFWDDLELTQSGPPACPCDWNQDHVLNSQDFFDFLVALFAGNADFNEDGTTNSQDFFDFLTCFFTGC